MFSPFTNTMPTSHRLGGLANIKSVLVAFVNTESSKKDGRDLKLLEPKKYWKDLHVSTD